MKNIIIFDTNYIISNKKKFELDLITENGYECYIPEIVIDEIKGQNARDIISEYTNTSNRLKTDVAQLYFKIVDTTNIEDAIAMSDKNIDKFIKLYFNKNIIPNDKPSETFKTLLDRSKYKKPPFKDKDSDKGFKDTLIWICILNYCKTNNDNEVLFVTKDNDFLKNKQQLEIEFNSTNQTNKISIIDDDELTNILKKKTNTEPEKVSENPLVVTIVVESKLDQQKIERIRSIVDGILYSETYNDFYNNGPETIENYAFPSFITEDQAIRVCDLMVQKEMDYIFYDQLDMLEIFVQSGIMDAITKASLSRKGYSEFTRIYQDIKDNYPSYLPSFIKYLTEKFNTMHYYSEISIEGEDLPF